MKFTVNRDTLLPPLQLVAGVVERRQTMPVLANVLLGLAAANVSLTGTDTEVEIVGRLRPQSVTETGEITVPARKLVDICRSLPEGALIDLALNEDQRLLIKSGRSRFTLSTLPTNDFPATEFSSGDIQFSCPQSLIKRLIDNTRFAMAEQDVRYYLNGMLWEVDHQRLRCVATDGHRLAMCTRELAIGISEKIQAILPRKGVIEFLRLLKDDDTEVVVNLSDHHMRLQVEDYTITSKLVDGKFPDYENVMPKGGHNILLGDRNELKQAFLRAAILSNEKYHGVRLIMADGLLTIVANNPDQEEAEEQVVVDYSGDPIEIGFNVSYLQDVADVLMNDQIKMTLSDGNSSILLEEPDKGDSVYVVMPMSL